MLDPQVQGALGIDCLENREEWLHACSLRCSSGSRLFLRALRSINPTCRSHRVLRLGHLHQWSEVHRGAGSTPLPPTVAGERGLHGMG